jgi:hypothetical protein
MSTSPASPEPTTYQKEVFRRLQRTFRGLVAFYLESPAEPDGVVTCNSYTSPLNVTTVEDLINSSGIPPRLFSKDPGVSIEIAAQPKDDQVIVPVLDDYSYNHQVRFLLNSHVPLHHHSDTPISKPVATLQQPDEFYFEGKVVTVLDQ